MYGCMGVWVYVWRPKAPNLQGDSPEKCKPRNRIASLDTLNPKFRNRIAALDTLNPKFRNRIVALDIVTGKKIREFGGKEMKRPVSPRPKPQTLNPKPQTVYQAGLVSTIDPRPQTPNLEPQTLEQAGLVAKADPKP